MHSNMQEKLKYETRYANEKHAESSKHLNIIGTSVVLYKILLKGEYKIFIFRAISHLLLSPSNAAVFLIVTM